MFIIRFRYEHNYGGKITTEENRILPNLPPSEGKAGIGDLKAVLPLDEGPAAFALLAKGPTDDIKVFLSA